MFKKSIIAVAALATVAAALPAFAATDQVFGTHDYKLLPAIKTSIIERLDHQGIKAADIGQWGQYVRAEVKLADGTNVVRFFEPNTLVPVPISQVH